MNFSHGTDRITKPNFAGPPIMEDEIQADMKDEIWQSNRPRQYISGTFRGT